MYLRVWNLPDWLNASVAFIVTAISIVPDDKDYFFLELMIHIDIRIKFFRCMS